MSNAILAAFLIVFALLAGFAAGMSIYVLVAHGVFIPCALAVTIPHDDRDPVFAEALPF